MHYRLLLGLLLPLPIAFATAFAQSGPDPQQAILVEHAHLQSLTNADVNKLLSEAQSGNAEAQYWVGRSYQQGHILAKDSDQASKWFLKSAEQGYLSAQREYGLMFSHLDPPLGERWLLKAAEHGDAESQLWLGVAYEQNWFGTTDANESLKWYRKAAESGQPDAQFILGQKYEDGDGVDQNYELASKWYRKSADHSPNLGGAGHGRYHLGLLYMQGRGVPQDYVQAYLWFSLSGPDENVEEAKRHLTAPQIREAEQLVRQWKEQHLLSPEIAASLSCKQSVESQLCW